MKITAIKQQEKLKGRYSIFVDEKYAFSLSDTALLDAKLVTGQELTEQELKEYKELSADDKIYGLVLRYVAIRPRSKWEIETYLQRKHSPPPLQEKILNKLSINNLIDDKAFAESWVASRRLLKPISTRRLQLELKQKRISEEIIQQVLADDETDEKTVLKELITRKRKQSKYQDNEKLIAYLSRQGFNYGDIKDVFSEIDEEA
jgi:regulatory protein